MMIIPIKPNISGVKRRAKIMMVKKVIPLPPIFWAKDHSVPEMVLDRRDMY